MLKSFKQTSFFVALVSLCVSPYTFTLLAKHHVDSADEKVATLKVWWGLRQRVCVCVSKRDGKWNETGRFPLDRTHWKGHQLCSLFIAQCYHPSLTLLLQLTLFLNMFFPVGSINIWRPHYLLPLFNLVVLSYCFHLLSSTAPSVSYIKDWMFFECTFSLIF